MNEIKYEPLYGLQKPFDNGPADSTAYGLFRDGDEYIYYKIDKTSVYCFDTDNQWSHIDGAPTIPFLAMRRIIAEPKRWTVEDQEAGQLPDVGVKVRDKPSGVIGEVAAVDGQLLDTGVFVKSLPEYLVVVGLYQMAGCKIWPWHEGYKDPNDGDDISLYVYKNAGFFKEIYPVAVGVKVLTIPELVEIVTGKQAAKAQAVPEGLKVVPAEPNQAQFGGMARDVIQWMRFTESKNQHSESLVKWLKDMGNEIPEWLYSEPEINNLSKHVISKGTIAAIIYKAMLEAAPEQNK